MVDARVTFGLSLVVAGFVILCTSLPEIAPRLSMQPWRGDRLHPVAALAWSTAHCGSQLSLVPGTPGLQRDDLLEISGRFDEIEQEQGHMAACDEALERAAPVAETNRPEYSRIAATGSAQSP